MAFNDTVLTAIPDLVAGEFIAASPYNCSAFELFEEGLVPGRFAKYAADSVDLLDGSATPILVGVVRRKIASALENATYTHLGIAPDQVAEVINFGFATVTVTDAATPSRYDQVYTVNAAGADSGKATDDSGQLIVPGCIFWEAKAAGVWLVRVMMGVETSTSLVGSPANLLVTPSALTGGDATLTIQARNADGSDYLANVLTRVWVGTANDFGADAITGITVVTGTSKQVVTANAELLVITDATGTAVLTLNNGGAGTIYAWAELAGNIYPSGAIVITA